METTYTFLNAIQDCGINDGTCLVGVTPRNGASLHKVREFAGHANICTTELYFVRKEEDAEVAARRIQIRVTGQKGE